MTTKEVAIVENNVMNPSMVPSAWQPAAYPCVVVAAPIALHLEGDLRVRTAALVAAAQRDGATSGFGKRGFAAIATPGPSAWSPPV